MALVTDPDDESINSYQFFKANWLKEGDRIRIVNPEKKNLWTLPISFDITHELKENQEALAELKAAFETITDKNIIIIFEEKSPSNIAIHYFGKNELGKNQFVLVSKINKTPIRKIHESVDLLLDEIINYKNELIPLNFNPESNEIIDENDFIFKIKKYKNENDLEGEEFELKNNELTIFQSSTIMGFTTEINPSSSLAFIYAKAIFVNPASYSSLYSGNNIENEVPYFKGDKIPVVFKSLNFTKFYKVNLIRNNFGENNLNERMAFLKIIVSNQPIEIYDDAAEVNFTKNWTVFTFPIKIVQEKIETNNTTNPEKSQKTVLWVYDDPFNDANESIIKKLIENNYTVDHLKDTETALHSLQTTDYELIISDLSRGKDTEAGINLLKEIKNRNIQTRFVLYTTKFSLNKYEKQAMELGAFAVKTGRWEVMFEYFFNLLTTNKALKIPKSPKIVKPKSQEILLLAVSNIDLPAIKAEIMSIRNNLQTAINQEYVETIEKLNVDFNTLDNLLNDNTISSQITMLHYTGHSNEAGILVEKGGIKKIMIISSIKTLIETHKKFRFVFLNSCYSESIAQQLIDVGVPFVIGTVSKVGDEDVSKVAAKFYEYLGINSLTIEEAYEKTKSYFFANPNELRLDGNFRLLTEESAEVEKENSILKLFYDENKLTQEQKDWTLIPKENIILSDPANKNKLKIFCIFGIDEKSLEFFQKFSLYQETYHENRVVNGSLNISGTFREKSFIIEYNAADIIVNLVTKSFISFVDRYNILNLIDNYKNKKHCYMPIFESDEIFKNINWIDQTLILKPEPETIIRLYGLDFYDFKKSNNFEDNFEAFYKPNFENILYLSSPKLEIYKVENITINEKIQFNNWFYHSIIEWSDLPIEKLLKNKFYEQKGINSNEKIIIISFGENEGIQDDKDFWISLYEGISGANSKIISSSEEYISECLNIIIGSLQNSQVVLIFDRVNIELHNSIIYNFCQKIIVELEKFQGYLKKNKNNEAQFSGKLFLFQINFNQNLFEFEKIVMDIYKKREVINHFDSEKNRWGGESSINGKELIAEISESLTKNSYNIKLSIKDPNKANNFVAIFLPNPFIENIVIPQFKDGEAFCELSVARKDFTVGAYLQDGTMLELDLLKGTKIP